MCIVSPPRVTTKEYFTLMQLGLTRLGLLTPKKKRPSATDMSGSIGGQVTNVSDPLVLEAPPPITVRVGQ